MACDTTGRGTAASLQRNRCLPAEGAAGGWGVLVLPRGALFGNMLLQKSARCWTRLLVPQAPCKGHLLLST